MGGKMKILRAGTGSCKYCFQALFLLFMAILLQCPFNISVFSIDSLQKQLPPRPPSLPVVMPRLSWLIRLANIIPKQYPQALAPQSNTEDSYEDAEVITASSIEEEDDLILTNPSLNKPQLALVPVVDHEQPFVMFWYPLHPQIPIKNYYY